MTDKICRIECLVDDRKLASVLRALAGLVLQDPKVQPVINAQADRKGKVSAPTSGRLIEMFEQQLRRDKLTEVTIAYAKEFLRAQGKAETSYNYLMTLATEHNLVRRVGKGLKRRFLVKEPSK